MDRLTSEDRLMLWPDERWPQEVGALAVLDGAALFDRDGQFRLEHLQRSIESRLHLVPRFRQVLHTPGPLLGGPLWVDAQGFDVADHIRVVDVPEPGDDSALLGVVERLIARRLDRSKPLWQMCFMTGLPGGRIGLLIRVHHCIADGIAAIAMLTALMDTEAEPRHEPARPWAPEAPPTARALFVDNLRRLAKRAGGAVSSAIRKVRSARQSGAAVSDLRKLWHTPPTTSTSLDRPVGPSRRLAIIRAGLEPARAAGHRHGATINDILLAATTAGLRELLRNRGELTDDLSLPAYMPATLRPPGDRDRAIGNAIAQTVVPLPVGDADPHRRLEKITAGTEKQKCRSHSDLGAVFRGRLARRVLLLLLRRHPVSVTTADLLGPRQPIHIAGARLIEAFPILPLIGNVTIGIGALSYADQLNIAVVADRDVVPDLATFTAGAQDQLQEFQRI